MTSFAGPSPVQPSRDSFEWEVWRWRCMSQCHERWLRSDPHRTPLDDCWMTNFAAALHWRCGHLGSNHAGGWAGGSSVCSPGVKSRTRQMMKDPSISAHSCGRPRRPPRPARAVARCPDRPGGPVDHVASFRMSRMTVGAFIGGSTSGPQGRQRNQGSEEPKSGHWLVLLARSCCSPKVSNAARSAWAVHPRRV
jgi:hypothetical protein